MAHNKLRGRIIEKYGSIKKFSEELKISQQSANLKVSGKTGFSRNDIIEWSQLLSISNDECYDFFIE